MPCILNLTIIHAYSQLGSQNTYPFADVVFVNEEWGLPSLSRQSLGLPSQILFTFHIPHMSYRHNLYHLTHVAYQTCSADETFPKCPMEFHLKPISNIGENLPMKFGSCRHSHMIFLQCVPLAHSSSIQIVKYNPYLLIQSKFDCSITKQ